MDCHACDAGISPIPGASGLNCTNCYWKNGEVAIFENDPVYHNRTRKLVWACCGLLPIAYVAGLIYTLRTHAHIYESTGHESDDMVRQRMLEQQQQRELEEEEAAAAASNNAGGGTDNAEGEGGAGGGGEFDNTSSEVPWMDDDGDGGGHGHGHDLGHGPIWSKVKSITILLISTVLLALVAELVVKNVEVLVRDSAISETAIGLVLVSLLPDAAEIVNGIKFALEDNIALSIEIGSSIAVQVCLLQVPILVFVSEISLVQDEDPMKHFTLIFPDLQVFAVFFSAILMNYVFQDGKSDYFQGVVLLIIYIIMLAVLIV